MDNFRKLQVTDDVTLVKWVTGFVYQEDKPRPNVKDKRRNNNKRKVRRNRGRRRRW